MLCLLRCFFYLKKQNAVLGLKMDESHTGWPSLAMILLCEYFFQCVEEHYDLK